MNNVTKLPQLQNKVLYIIVAILLLGSLFLTNVFTIFANNLNNLELLKQKRSFISGSYLLNAIEPLFPANDLRNPYIAGMAGLSHQVYEPAFEILREDQLDLNHKNMLAWQLGIELLAIDEQEQAANTWHYLVTSALDILDQKLTIEAQEAEINGEFYLAERNRRVLTQIFDTDRTRYDALGDFYIRNNRKAEGVEVFIEGSKLVSDADGQYLLGRAAEAQGHRAEAIQAHRHSIELGAQNHQTYFRLAQLISKEEKGTDNEAISLCTEAIAIAPGKYQCYELLAQVYREQGNSQLARHWLENGIRSVARASYKALFLRELGNLARDDHQWNGAEIYYLRSLELKESDPFALQGLAQTLIAKGEYESALIYYEHAIEWKGKKETVPVTWLIELGRLYQQLGMNHKAVQVFQLVLHRDPDNQVVLDAMNGSTP